MKEKCFVREKGQKKCKEEYYGTIRVQLFHLKSLRRSWQTWKMCKKHFFQFVEKDGKGWFCWYKNGKTDAQVIKFIIEGLK